MLYVTEICASDWLSTDLSLIFVTLIEKRFCEMPPRAQSYNRVDINRNYVHKR